MHPNDELLSAYALDPSSVEEAGELEAHLAHCAPCRQRLDEFCEIEALLARPESWAEDEPARAPLALSAKAARNRREDAEAEELLAPMLERFLAGRSALFVYKDIASKPEFHTGGVVRKLADAADKAQYSVPRRALILGETASAIVGMLSKTTYSAAEIAALRGLSWKQQANANRQLGQFNAAFHALERAERAYRELPRPEFDLASVTFIRATLYFYQGMYELAAQHAERSTETFALLRETDFYLRSRHLQGCIAFEEGDIGQAQVIFDSVLAYGETTGDTTWIARESQVLGFCHLERRELVRAWQFFNEGMLAFRDLGILSEEIRCRWGLALVVQREGRYRAAIPRLRDVRDEFADSGAVYDAALVTLDIMETFLLLGKPREVRRTAGSVVKLFKEAGVVSGAITAAAYLKEAAAMSSVTSSLIDYIRKYLRRVDVQPDLVFVPPRPL